MSRLPNKWAMKGPLPKEVVDYLKRDWSTVYGDPHGPAGNCINYYLFNEQNKTWNDSTTNDSSYKLITLEQFREMTGERVWKVGTRFFHKDTVDIIYNISTVEGGNVTISWGTSKTRSVPYSAKMLDEFFADGTWIIKQTEQTEQANMKQEFSVGGTCELRKAFFDTLVKEGYSSLGKITKFDSGWASNFTVPKKLSDYKHKAIASSNEMSYIHYTLPEDWDRALKAFRDYYEEEYKIGDYLYYNHNGKNLSGGTIHQIINIKDGKIITNKSEFLVFLTEILSGGFHSGRFRRATAEEIKEAQKPKSRKVSVSQSGGNFSVEVFKDKVVFEDVTISLESLKSLVDINCNRTVFVVGKWSPKFTKVDIGCKKDVPISDLANLLGVANQL